ncbi:serpin family protein [Candidatus Woesearchaeota archaeon]|nr:serpin family protein [Candidatus Woesearchaeota archaeon]
MRKIIALVIALLVLAGCNGTVDITHADDSLATPETLEEVVDSNNQFALELYSYLSQKEGNVFFSPYSISTALAMTYEGAGGETAEEMANVFHFAENSTARQSSFAAIYNLINSPDSEYKLNTANALWAQQDYPFLETYKSTIEKYYGGKTTNMDFISNSEGSRKTINSWVEDKTNDKIKDLLPQGSINSMTRLVLTNAIYFKGKWVMEFEKKRTRDSDFWTNIETRTKIQVPMMERTDKDAKFNYAETEEVKVLEMPYKGEDISMLVILPRESLDNLSISVEKIEQWKSMLQNQRVDVYFPKFKFEKGYPLKETLSAMGMPTAFSMDADFSGIDGAKGLFIDEVYHKAYVNVDEEGTEAAAATAVVMEMSAMLEQKIFRADHPFIFMIQERSTGSILFMGRVSNPAE